MTQNQVGYSLSSIYVGGSKESLSELHEFVHQTEKEAKETFGALYEEKSSLKMHPTVTAISHGIPLMMWIPIQ